MRLAVSLLAASAILLAVPALAGQAHGSWPIGDVAPPIDFAGMAVTVSTKLYPYGIMEGEMNQVGMEVRFFDYYTDQNLQNVTYRVEMWRDGQLLARHHFYDDDGTLNVDIRPVPGCAKPRLEECSTYHGTEHPSIPEALYAAGAQNPVISGPIFDKGGLYNIKVHVEGAAGPKALLTSILSFDTFVSVAQEWPFAIQTATAKVPVTVIAYYDEVENLRYCQSDSSIAFDMPFDWSPDYVDRVFIVHQELQVPKTFEPYSDGRQFRGFVDGVEVDKRLLTPDPYSYEDRNAFHFILPGNELQRIGGVLDEEHEDSRMMTFQIVAESEIQRSSLEFYLADPEDGSRTGTNVNVSWDSWHAAGGEIPVELGFFDEDGNLLRDIRYGYALYDHESGRLLASDMGEGGRGIAAPDGMDAQALLITSQNTHRLEVTVYGQGTSGPDSDEAYSGIGSTLIGVCLAAPPAIPDRIRGSVGLWVEGTASDGEFVGAIQSLIRQGIIVVPETEVTSDGSTGIPEWIRGSAGLWVDGTTSDGEFVGAIQFLIRQGVIVV